MAGTVLSGPPVWETGLAAALFFIKYLAPGFCYVNRNRLSKIPAWVREGLMVPHSQLSGIGS